MKICRCIWVVSVLGCISWWLPVGSLMLLRWHKGQPAPHTCCFSCRCPGPIGSGGTGAGHRTGFNTS